MKKVLLISPFLIFVSLFSNAQIDYQVRIDELYSAADDNDGGGFAGSEDPTWKIELTDDDANNFSAGCINVTKLFDSWWTGTPTTGISIPFTFPQVINSSATMLTSTMECWESDCCEIGSCSTDPCTFVNTGFCVNGDNYHAPAGGVNGTTGNAGDVNFINDAPCTWNQYTLEISGDNMAVFRARISIKWEPTGGTIDPGSIDGDQTVCEGDNPTELGSITDGTPADYPSWYTYQWQQQVGCGVGIWNEIPGATASTYTADPGILQTTCFRRQVKSAFCATVESNVVTVTVNTVSDNPSSLDAEPAILCGTGTVDLTINGGVLGTNATWEWYDGDPNGGGMVLFTTGTDPFVIGLAISSTTNYFVRAEGTCGNSDPVNVNVVVNTPNTAPTGVTVTSSAVCDGGATDLTVNGGSLGTGATWAWYDTDPATGTPASIYSNTSATYPNVIPAATTTYYVRAEGCDTTATVQTTITFNTPSTDPSTITADPILLCGTGTVDLTINGGSLGSGATWEWYDGDPNGGGNFLFSTGSSPSINGQAISSTTNYFVRAEGVACGNSNTANVNVVVSTPNTQPTSIIVGNASICLGAVPDLTVDGGSLGTGATWAWYDTDPTTGTPAWISSSASNSYSGAAPLTTTTYYVRAEGCDTTAYVQTTIAVNTPSTDPTAITATPTILCGAGDVDLNVIGGSLGTDANWEWYDDPSLAVIVGTGNSITVPSVSANTTFYVRAEGGVCGNSNTAEEEVIISSPNTAPTGVSFTSPDVCAGDATDLTVEGGSLGAGANWTWYDTDPTISSPPAVFNSTTTVLYSGVSPATTTTYYVRAEGCDTTTAVQTTITVIAPSVAASGISATQTSLCTGDGSTLEIQGGTLGAGAAWVWYEGGCGAGSSISSGTALTLDVNPTATTSYYVRAEGGCNGNTECVNITISIDIPSTDPVAIASANTVLCPGESTVLNVSGGTLGTGAVWEWYQGSCGGIYVGQGSSVSITPSSSATYFVRAEGACGPTNCVSIEVSVGVGASDPDSASVSINNICPGDTTQLSVAGAVLNPEYVWVWYTGACGAVTAGIGSTLDVMPTLTTTYYVRAVGTCGQTNCVSVTVDVLTAAVMADGITSDNNYFCAGDSALLEVYGGTIVAGSDWVWYKNSCGGSPIGTGTTLTVYPSTNTAYFVRAEGGTCGNTSCVSISINVLDAYAYMTPFDTLCGMGYPFDLVNGVPEGGVYSGTGITDGQFDPTLAGEGTHSVTYTYTEANGCVAIATEEIVIDSNDIVASVSIVPETCAEGGITLVGSTYGGSGYYIYEWSNGYIGNPLKYVDAGTYSLIVVDGSNCVSIIPDIVVSEDVSCIEMPNSFTPNNDGTNDMWNLDFSSYSNGSIQVYSKWGTLVWESSGTSLSWDGTSNGQVLPAGTYYYILDIDNGTLTQNGPVTIVK